MAILHKLYWASDLGFKILNEDVDNTYDADNDEYDDGDDDLEPWELILKVALDVGHIFLLSEGSLLHIRYFILSFSSLLIFACSMFQTLKALAVHTPANTWGVTVFLRPFQRFKWSYDQLSRVIKWRFNCISSTWMLCKNHPEHFWLLSSIHKCRLLLSALMWCWKKLHTWILKSVASDSGGLAWAYILHARLSTNLNQDITLNKVTEWAQYMATSNLEKEINKCVLGLNRRQRP